MSLTVMSLLHLKNGCKGKEGKGNWIVSIGTFLVDNNKDDFGAISETLE